MKRLSEFSLAVMAGLMGLIAGHPTWSVWSMALMFPVAGLVTAVAGVTHATTLATRRGELEARLAMGESRRGVLWRHVGMGALAGVTWGLPALLLGTVAGALLGYSWWPPAYGWLATIAGIFAVILVTGGAVGWGCAAAWALRSPARDIADSDRTAAAAAAPARAMGTRRVWAWIAGGLVAFGTLGLLGAVPLSSASGPFGTALTLVALAGVYIAAPALLVWAGTALGTRIVRRLGTALSAGSPAASARGLAGGALARRMPLRGAAIGAIGLVLALASGISVAYNGNEARNLTARALVPDAIVSTVHVDLGEPTTPPTVGWAPALPADVVSELASDDRLMVVPAAVLGTEQTSAPGDQAYEPGGVDQGMTFIALDPRGLDGLRPHGLRPLYVGGDTVAAFVDAMRVGIVEAPVSHATVAHPFTAVDRAWAEAQFGAGEEAALLVYLEDSVPRDGSPAASSGASVGEILAEHSLAGIQVTFGNPAVWAPSTSIDGARIWLIAGPFLLGALALVVAVSASSQRLRAREHATMAALGAHAGTMRRAAAWEAAVVTGVGAALGLAAGALLGPLVSQLNGAGDLAMRWWNVGFDLAQAPWGALIGLAAVAVAAAACAASLLRIRVDRSTPAEQLREAQKEGVL